MALHSIPSDSIAIPELAPDRYLMLSFAYEGFGAWNDIVWEFVDLAKQLGRTFVEPCVRNGCLEPCRYGHVISPGSSEEIAAAYALGEDPLDLPHISSPCEPIGVEALKRTTDAYPLSVYLDISVLQKHWPHFIPYDVWFERTIKKQGLVPDGPNGRYILPSIYCGDIQYNWCVNGRDKYRQLGDFAFERDLAGRKENVVEQVNDLLADPAETLFYHSYYRLHFHDADTFPNVVFHPGHYLAVEQFKRDLFGKDSKLYVFQWRTEHVAYNALVPCAKILSSIVSKLKLEKGPSGFHAVLVSDMPAPNNPNQLWHTYEGGSNRFRHEAVDVMFDSGLIKYDFYHNNTDNGVLMIRDFILTQTAHEYATCFGDFVEKCHGCFRSLSNFVERIFNSRRRQGKSVNLDWFEVKKNDDDGSLM
jgi:hypothetical protein